MPLDNQAQPYINVASGADTHNSLSITAGYLACDFSWIVRRLGTQANKRTTILGPRGQAQLMVSVMKPGGGRDFQKKGLAPTHVTPNSNLHLNALWTSAM